MEGSSGDIHKLSRRERQIMEVIYRQKGASARDVLEQIEDPPSYSAIRASMRILEEKGFLTHREKEGRYLFEPTVRLDRAKRSAIFRVVETFFENSASKALNTLLSSSELEVDDDELDRLEAMIAKARKEKRGKSDR